MNDTYRPISCASHERLEFAVLRRQWLDIEITDGERAGRWRLMPLDVYAREGVEWLEAQTQAGEKLVLRLDHLRF